VQFSFYRFIFVFRTFGDTDVDVFIRLVGRISTVTKCENKLWWYGSVVTRNYIDRKVVDEGEL
jgi:hypothetical protein